MAFTVITPMILLAYAIEGRKAVQSTSLDYIFCAVAAAILIAAGGNPINSRASGHYCTFYQSKTLF